MIRKLIFLEYMQKFPVNPTTAIAGPAAAGIIFLVMNLLALKLSRSPRQPLLPSVHGGSGSGCSGLANFPCLPAGPTPRRR
jgi:hypothetical protein